MIFDNCEMPVVQKKRCSPETPSFWPGVHPWSKKGLTELGKGVGIALKKLDLRYIYVCVCVWMCNYGCTASLALCGASLFGGG